MEFKNRLFEDFVPEIANPAKEPVTTPAERVESAIKALQVKYSSRIDSEYQFINPSIPIVFGISVKYSANNRDEYVKEIARLLDRLSILPAENKPEHEHIIQNLDLARKNDNKEEQIVAASGLLQLAAGPEGIKITSIRNLAEYWLRWQFAAGFKLSDMQTMLIFSSRVREMLTKELEEDEFLKEAQEAAFGSIKRPYLHDDGCVYADPTVDMRGFVRYLFYRFHRELGEPRRLSIDSDAAIEIVAAIWSNDTENLFEFVKPHIPEITNQPETIVIEESIVEEPVLIEETEYVNATPKYPIGESYYDDTRLIIASQRLESVSPEVFSAYINEFRNKRFGIKVEILRIFSKEKAFKSYLNSAVPLAVPNRKAVLKEMTKVFKEVYL